MKILYEGHEIEVLDTAYIKEDYHSIATDRVKEFTTESNGHKYYKGIVPSYSLVDKLWISAGIVEVVADESTVEEFFDQDYKSPHLQDLGYSMVSWLDGLESRPDNDNLPPIVTLLMAIQYDKEGGYGSSWKGKGEYRGIMANIDRKYDRLDKMTQDEINDMIPTLASIESFLGSGTPYEVGESKIDAIADLANYCLLYMTYVREKYPKVFKVWVDKNIPQYLHDKIPFLQPAHKE